MALATRLWAGVEEPLQCAPRAESRPPSTIMKLRHHYLFVSMLAVIAAGVLCFAAPSPTGGPVVPLGLVASADAVDTDHKTVNLGVTA